MKRQLILTARSSERESETYGVGIVSRAISCCRGYLDVRELKVTYLDGSFESYGSSGRVARLP
jgi:hypothetical protein